ncbi:MAG TPA: sulfatase-like hydrolase/transferase, partial [Acidobacteriota bacterium]|nr:sulfatase-like hydrolase/transferase [Acidobacteriota bacterium]
MWKLRVALFALLTIALVSCKKEAPPAAKPEPLFHNLLLITIDTLRADALSVYGGKTPVPFLESFARNATVFNHAFTSAPITLPAHTSLMTGLYPPAHGVRNNGTFRAPESLHLLAEYAKHNGMSTGAVIGGFPLAAQFGLNQGFDF